MVFNTDKPITAKKDDLLNRAAFSVFLAKAILSYASTENYTIGLCGKWGSGKTSILNMVEEYIDENTNEDENRPIVVRFNPWNYSDRAQLITQFFVSILTELKGSTGNKGLKAVGEALEKYASLFEYTSLIPVVGSYLGGLKTIAEGTGKLLTEHNSDNNLELLKKKVIKALESQSQKVILVIDDIDRLNNHDIRLIFQLVNSVAGFPNMIYLLSFDKEIVVRALGEEQNCDGQEYLEKIIQIPFDIPEVQDDLIHKVLFSQLDEIWTYVDSRLFDKVHWSDVFTNCISPFIKTIRDVNRIINVYRFSFSLLRNETDCADLLAITTLKVCAPEIYRWIFQHLNSLCGFSNYGITGIDQDKNKKRYLDTFRSMHSAPYLMLTTLQTLFPKFGWETGSHSRFAVSEDELRRYHRIALSENAPLYFNLSLDEVRISRSTILNMIDNYEEDQLESTIFALDTSEISYCLSQLKSHSVNIVPERKICFINVLVRLLSHKKYFHSEGLFSISPSYAAESFMWELLKSYPVKQRSEIIEQLIQNPDFEDFSVITNFICTIEKAFGRIFDDIDSTNQIITETELEQIEKLWYQKIESLKSTTDLIHCSYFLDLFLLWEKINKSTLTIYLKESINKNPINLPPFLMINHRVSIGRVRLKYFVEEDFSDYFTAEEIFSLSDSLIH